MNLVWFGPAALTMICCILFIRSSDPPSPPRWLCLTVVPTRMQLLEWFVNALIAQSECRACSPAGTEILERVSCQYEGLYYGDIPVPIQPVDHVESILPTWMSLWCCQSHTWKTSWLCARLTLPTQGSLRFKYFIMVSIPYLKILLIMYRS